MIEKLFIINLYFYLLIFWKISIFFFILFYFIAEICKFYKMDLVAILITILNSKILDIIKILTFIIVLTNCIDFTFELGDVIYLKIIKLNNLIWTVLNIIKLIFKNPKIMNLNLVFLIIDLNFKILMTQIPFENIINYKIGYDILLKSEEIDFYKQIRDKNQR